MTTIGAIIAEIYSVPTCTVLSHFTYTISFTFFFLIYYILSNLVSQVALVVKNPPVSAGDIRDMGLIPRSGRSPGQKHGNPL